MEAARSPDRSEFDALVAELLAVSPEFARFWNDHELIEIPQGLKVFVHPVHGPIEFEHVTLAYSEPNARPLRVTLYTPRPGDSSARASAVFGITPAT